uniref:Phospholipid-transporting ATPase n=1 Tax=Musa acuminata subsp. malaccensis TaxID=214687 RepID=A0A804I585_MUSAM
MAPGRRRHERLRWSKLYTFSCLRPTVVTDDEQPHPLQGPGYSRLVHCNQPGLHQKKPLNYCTNHISTTKYNIITFLPKAIFEQFRRVANLYFLLTASLSLTPAMEDWNRFMQDMKEIRVGDVVRVEKDQFFPADLLLLSSSYDDGICYVETMNLDGETNLKVKRSLEVTLPLDGQILLRDSKLRNTTYVYGVAIFTGHDSKVMQNSTESPSKRSRIEKKMDNIIYFGMPQSWYLQPSETSYVYDASKPVLSGFYHLLTALILYGYLIPISLYVSIEVVKVLQATFINQDIHMRDEETGNSAQARTSNLNEELGQVDTILSDKTGTLTCNQMDFLRCSIAGVPYGVVSSEDSGDGFGSPECELEPNAGTILVFLRVLALCHTAIAEANEKTGAFTYEAESPDEAAFLVAAREFGFEFCKRTQSSVFIRERYSASEDPFKVLNILEFNSKRKRMSVILRDETGQIILLCKGADRYLSSPLIILDRLSKNGRIYEIETIKHLNEYGEAGLRTLALAYRRVSDTIERDLILVGATAVEDKLQKGVPQCIDKLAQAGLKIWVLTGDKMETAINIGYVCLTSNSHTNTIYSNILSLNKEKVHHFTSIILPWDVDITHLYLEKDPNAAFALIIDGKTLTYALEDDLKNQFLSLAVNCASVICCRVSPKQKALVVTRLVKEGTGKTTLAIGDGANDVGMIQEADIGVGISGVEGMQAVMASDFSISQFRFLERLLVVHGHWCYKRIAQMICYFFYKNIAFGLTIFYFEAYTGFSGQSVYADWYMLLFNVILTSLPVISLGVFEQDVSSEVCLQFPALYQQGPRNLFFDWYRIFGWMGNGLYSSIVIYFLSIQIFYSQAFRANGQTADMAAHLFVWGSIATWYLFLIAYGMCSPVISGNAYRILSEALGPAPMYWAATLLVTLSCNIPYLVYIAFQRALNPLDHHVIQEIKYYRKDVEDQHMWKRGRGPKLGRGPRLVLQQDFVSSLVLGEFFLMVLCKVAWSFEGSV